MLQISVFMILLMINEIVSGGLISTIQNHHKSRNPVRIMRTYSAAPPGQEKQSHVETKIWPPIDDRHGLSSHSEFIKRGFLIAKLGIVKKSITNLFQQLNCRSPRVSPGFTQSDLMLTAHSRMLQSSEFESIQLHFSLHREQELFQVVRNGLGQLFRACVARLLELSEGFAGDTCDLPIGYGDDIEQRMLTEFRETNSCHFFFTVDGQVHHLDSVLVEYFGVDDNSFHVDKWIEGCRLLSYMVSNLTESITTSISYIPEPLMLGGIKRASFNMPEQADLLVLQWIAQGIRERVYKFVSRNFKEIMVLVQAVYEKTIADPNVDSATVGKIDANTSKVMLSLRMIKHGYGRHVSFPMICCILDNLYHSYRKYMRKELVEKFVRELRMHHMSSDILEPRLIQLRRTNDENAENELFDDIFS